MNAISRIGAPAFPAAVYRNNPQLAALELAEWLDAIDAGTTDDETDDLLLRIGDLLGGWSKLGFRHDLVAHLGQIEAEFIANATARDYSPSRGGTDPLEYMSDALIAAIDNASDAAARQWSAGVVLEFMRSPALA